MIGVLRRLLGLAAVPFPRVALAVSLGALAVAFGVGLMTAAGYLISHAAEGPPILALTTIIVAVRFFGLARPLARYLERLASHDLALHALGRVRARFYARIEPLAPAELETYRDGELVTRMVADVDTLQGLYLRVLGPPLVALAVGAGCVGATAALLPVAALVLAGGLVAAGVGVPLLGAFLARAAARRQAAVRGELTAELVDALRGAPELSAYGAEERTLERIRAHDRRLQALSRRDALVAGLTEALALLAAGTTVVGVLALAVAAHEVGSLDRVLLATVTLLALASFEAVAPLPSAARELAATLAAGRRVLELVAREPEVADPVHPAGPPPAAAVVALERVTARYPGASEPALRDLDLVLEPGRHLALVGPSGAGKSTVANLLLRFLDPTAGRVTIAGRDAREYRQEDVRAVFALAGQEAHLFDSTIRENLRLARPHATEDELVGALGRARILDWVESLPAGLDTPVGEGGTELSGGQRQRLVLARALLTDAQVLVLDEPTAHLDEPTARRLLADVLDAARDRTVLLITHRPEGLERMDETVRLVQGAIAARTPEVEAMA